MQEQDLIVLIFESLFLGFSLSVILVLILSLIKSELLKEFASNFLKYSFRVIRILAIIYIIYYTIVLIVLYSSNKVTLFNSRAVGPYAWAYWFMLLRPSIFCGLAQLFWFKKFRINKNLIAFLAILIFFTTLFSGVNFERFVIIVTSFHRDYLPNGWDLNDYNHTYDLVLLFIAVFLIEKLILFSSLVFTTWFISKRVSNKSTN